MKTMIFKQLIDGLMLGDGNLFLPKNGVNVKYQQGSSYSEFVQHVKDELSKFDIEFDTGIRIQIQENRNGAVGYHIRSRTNTVLTEQYKIWYPEGTKIVPNNIELTPITCLYWYLGDGGLHYSKLKFKGLRLCTQGFVRDDIMLLSDKMKSLGFKNYVESKGVIGLSPISARKFISYIGICPVSCYGYKWCTDSRWIYDTVKSHVEMGNQQPSP
jgi:hypothetical protein